MHHVYSSHVLAIKLNSKKIFNPHRIYILLILSSTNVKLTISEKRINLTLIVKRYVYIYIYILLAFICLPLNV